MSKNYAWVIDRDHLFENHPGLGPSEAGVKGPSTAPDYLQDALENGQGAMFRMYDDDGEFYYTGRIVFGEDSHPDATGSGLTEDAFGPLDDFGMPNAGCTEIRYREGTKWVTL